MIGYELERLAQDACQALENISDRAEDFVKTKIYDGIAWGVGGWNDACGRKIGEEVVASVEQAVSDRINIYDCKSKLEGVGEVVESILDLIDRAQRELN